MRERGAQKGLRGWWASLLVRPASPLPSRPPLETGGEVVQETDPRVRRNRRYQRVSLAHTPAYTTSHHRVPPKIPKSTRNKGLPSSTPSRAPPLPPAGASLAHACTPPPPPKPLCTVEQRHESSTSRSRTCVLSSVRLSRSPVTGGSTCAPESPLRRASYLDRARLTPRQRAVPR